MTVETNRLTMEDLFGSIPPALIENDVVFHYTKLSTAVEEILFTKKLRLSPLSESDDPFEQLANGFPGGFGMGQMGFDRTLMSANREVGHKAQPKIMEGVNRVRYVSFCKNGSYGRVYERAGSTEDDYGFFKQRMWSQYAQHSTGICLAFSRRELIRQAEGKFAGHLFYAEEMEYENFDRIEVMSPTIRVDTAAEQGEERFVHNYLNTWHRVLCFMKHVDFQGENEFRIAVFPRDTDLDDPFIDISSSLIGVIANSIPAHPYMKLLCECVRGNCPLWRLEWDNRRVSLFQVDCETGRH